MADYISGVIARIDAKGKILDMRDQLVLAAVEDYSMMHGAGGAKHEFKSTIKFFITDYSDEKNSKTATANVGPEVISELLCVCEKTLGELYVPKPVNAEATNIALTMARSLLTTATKLTDGEDAGKLVINEGSLVALGKQISAAVKELAQYNAGLITPAKPNVTYTHTQTRVHSFKTDPKDGKCPVELLSIYRQPFMTNGTVKQKPWTVKITKCRATPITHEKGTVTYNTNSVVDSSDVFIMVSDEDMYAACYRVSRYIEVWEMIHCIPRVREGIALKKKKDEEYRLSQQGQQAANY